MKSVVTTKRWTYFLSQHAIEPTSQTRQDRGSSVESREGGRGSSQDRAGITPWGRAREFRPPYPVLYDLPASVGPIEGKHQGPLSVHDSSIPHRLVLVKKAAEHYAYFQLSLPLQVPCPPSRLRGRLCGGWMGRLLRLASRSWRRRVRVCGWCSRRTQLSACTERMAMPLGLACRPA